MGSSVLNNFSGGIRPRSTKSDLRGKKPSVQGKREPGASSVKRRCRGYQKEGLEGRLWLRKRNRFGKKEFAKKINL